MGVQMSEVTETVVLILQESFYKLHDEHKSLRVEEEKAKKDLELIQNKLSHNAKKILDCAEFLTAQCPNAIKNGTWHDVSEDILKES